MLNRRNHSQKDFSVRKMCTLWRQNSELRYKAGINPYSAIALYKSRTNAPRTGPALILHMFIQKPLENPRWTSKLSVRLDRSVHWDTVRPPESRPASGTEQFPAKDWTAHTGGHRGADNPEIRQPGFIVEY